MLQMLHVLLLSLSSVLRIMHACVWLAVWLADLIGVFHELGGYMTTPSNSKPNSFPTAGRVVSIIGNKEQILSWVWLGPFLVLSQSSQQEKESR